MNLSEHALTYFACLGQQPARYYAAPSVIREEDLARYICGDGGGEDLQDIYSSTLEHGTLEHPRTYNRRYMKQK